MTKSFDEWMVDAESWSERDAYEAGQQSKQAEVDELQKRIGEALKFANDAHSDLNIGMLKMVDILKGNANEH